MPISKSTHEYDVGDAISTTVMFKVGGVLTDPTSVVFKHKNPSGTVTMKTYGTNDEVVKVSTGTYRMSFTLSASGTWYYRWAGTGTATGAAERSVQVRASEF